VEFVIALPLLLAMLAFAVQYGNALKVRNNLDIASRDAARYLARVPLQQTGSDISVAQVFIDQARSIIENRLGSSDSMITNFDSSTDAIQASVDVTIQVPFPLLEWIGLFDQTDASLTMNASERWTRTGTTIVTVSSSS
jgi:Flp pilus assembly protein TadG